jgi:hypothetical protein
MPDSFFELGKDGKARQPLTLRADDRGFRGRAELFISFLPNLQKGSKST